MHRAQRLHTPRTIVPSASRPDRVTSCAASHTAGSNSSTSSHRSLCTRTPRTDRWLPANSSTRLPFCNTTPPRRRRPPQYPTPFAQQRPLQQRGQVLVHLPRLLQRPAQNPHLHPRLEQQVQQRRHRPQHRLAPAPVRPHHTVAAPGNSPGTRSLKIAVQQVIERGRRPRRHRRPPDVQPQPPLHEPVQRPRRRRPQQRQTPHPRPRPCRHDLHRHTLLH